MTPQEIVEALHLVAMGRPRHDKVLALAEFLGAKEPASEPEALPVFPTSEQVEAAKDAKPKRAKKAD